MFLGEPILEQGSEPQSTGWGQQESVGDWWEDKDIGNCCLKITDSLSKDSFSNAGNLSRTYCCYCSTCMESPHSLNRATISCQNTSPCSTKGFHSLLFCYPRFLDFLLTSFREVFQNGSCKSNLFLCLPLSQRQESCFTVEMEGSFLENKKSTSSNIFSSLKQLKKWVGGKGGGTGT